MRPQPLSQSTEGGEATRVTGTGFHTAQSGGSGSELTFGGQLLQLEDSLSSVDSLHSMFSGKLTPK